MFGTYCARHDAAVGITGGTRRVEGCREHTRSPAYWGLFPDGNRPSIKRRECLTPQVLKATFMG